MITGKVTIKGIDYELGELSASDENVELLEALINDKSDSVPLAGFKRALREAITNGAGEKKAKEAMAALSLSLNKDSDMMRAVKALSESLV